MSRNSQLVDSHGRIIRDLRVSVTDRCNFRCMYCLPETEEAANFYLNRFQPAADSIKINREWQPQSRMLTFEEIARFVRIGRDLGIQKIRLTGGEPLLRKDFEKLVGMLAKIDGIHDIAMTTNGFLFKQKGKALRDAGLSRVSFSLDSLDRENFAKITGRDALSNVCESIDLAITLGFSPLKINAVIIKGVNDHEVVELVRFARSKGASMRFIEFMPLDSNRAWQKELVMKGNEILEVVKRHFELTPKIPVNASETAKRWGFPDGKGELGIIAPVSEPFCGHCNRLRLTADGQLRTCLFSLNEHDLRGVLRAGSSDEEVALYAQSVVLQKEAGHRIGQKDFAQPLRTMSCIGG
ncbi:MAG: 3,8-cyclase [Verrucomicrobiales bacterium]|nr:3,8-cyclase [Verrucomicrobiales bacterium]